MADPGGRYSTLELAGDNTYQATHETEQSGMGVDSRQEQDLPEVVEGQDLSGENDPKFRDVQHLAVAGGLGMNKIHADVGDGLEVNPNFVAATPDLTPNTKEAGKEDVYHGEKKIFGIKRKTFIITAAVVGVIVLAAIIGGVVGTVTKKNTPVHSDVSSPQTQTTTGAPASPTSAGSNSTVSILHPNSGLASVNWTDTSNVTYRAVFYQDKNTFLYASVKNSTNETWFVHNISASPDPGSLRVLPGTPITAAIAPVFLGFQLNIYVLSTQNRVLEIVTHDHFLNSWDTGAASTGSTGIQASVEPGSKLASYYWYPCDTCSGETAAVLFQVTTDQHLEYGNSSAGWNNPKVLNNNPVDSSSGIAIIGHGSTGGLNELKAYVLNNGVLTELGWSEGNPNWAAGSDLTQGLPSTPQITGITFSTNNGIYNNLFVGALFTNGSILFAHNLNNNWSLSPAKLDRGGNFSAIAMNAEMGFYGISAGVISEYAINSSSPESLTYTGIVNIPSVATTG